MYSFKFNMGRGVPHWQLNQNYSYFHRLIHSTSKSEVEATNPDIFGQLGAHSREIENSNNNRTTKKKDYKQFQKIHYKRNITFDGGKRQVKAEVESIAADTNTKTKHYRQFPKLQYNRDITSDRERRDQVALGSYQEETALEKWNRFKDEEYKEILKLSGLKQDDSEEDFYNLFQKNDRTKHLLKDKVILSEESQAASLSLAMDNDDNRDIQRLENLASIETISDANTELQKAPNPDSFGTISPPKLAHEVAEGDEGDRREEEFMEARMARKDRPQYYGQRMKNLCQERKLSEALHILEVEMPGVRARPNSFCYNILISACGRAGYTKKAFQLYNKMKQRGLNVHALVYTGLFNACAHSPWPSTDGLQRATRLRSQLAEKAYPVNQTISHAMIKAFGRCDDIKTAFQIVDEMVAGGLLVTTQTLNFLLQACITDKNSGFRHAVMVWQKMRQLNLSPDIYSYNLLIRCTAECQAGDPCLTSQILPSSEQQQEPHSTTTRFRKKDNQKKVITEKVLLVDVENIPFINRNTNSPTSFGDTGTCSKESYLSSEVGRKCELGKESHCKEMEVVKEVKDVEGANQILPNILGRTVKAGAVVGLGSLDKPHDRLALLGGMAGLVDQMVQDGVKPNLKTVTQLLTSLPSDTETEQALLNSVKIIGLEPDTQFCNMLIRKRNIRGDIEAAKDVLDMLGDYKLLPDLITYGCLAMGCHTLTQATKFLHDMDQANFRPNLEIMRILTKNGLVLGNFYYALEMLQEMKRRHLHPDTDLLASLEHGRARARNLLLKQEGGGRGWQRKVEGARLFLMEYKNWLKGAEVQFNDHPWAQYHTQEGQGLEEGVARRGFGAESSHSSRVKVPLHHKSGERGSSQHKMEAQHLAPSLQ